MGSGKITSKEMKKMRNRIMEYRTNARDGNAQFAKVVTGSIETQSNRSHKPKEIPMSSTTVVKDPVVKTSNSIERLITSANQSASRAGYGRSSR